jgi:hypothetical protein
LSLADRHYKILCISDEATIKGLHWSTTQHPLESLKLQFYAASLSQLAEVDLHQIDIVLCCVDLGQATPIENLKKVSSRPGLLAFVQPTPSQLLALSELPGWMPLAWDNVNFRKVLDGLLKLIQANETRLKERAFCEAAGVWLQNNLKKPRIVHFLNPPSTWAASTKAILDEDRGLLELGMLSSDAALCLPIQGREILGEFRFLGGNWSFHAKKAGIESRLNALQAGDQIVVEGWDLRLTSDSHFQSLSKVQADYLSPENRQSMEPTLSAGLEFHLREAMLSGFSGELRLVSGLRSGTIALSEGKIVAAVCGAAGGIKALLRILGMEKTSISLGTAVSSEWATGANLTKPLGLQAFNVLFGNWTDLWQRVRKFVPPGNLKLQVSPKQFLTKIEWKAAEAQVVASICEYQLVRDILNNCPLVDAEIFETMIVLRRQGIIEPAVQ